MTAHLLVLYPTPVDAQKFDYAYREEHLPLAGPKLKGATSVVTKRVVGPAFAPPPYHLMSDVSFPDMTPRKRVRCRAAAKRPWPMLRRSALVERRWSWWSSTKRSRVSWSAHRAKRQ